MKVGDRICIEAPSGSFLFSGKEAASVVLIGGGVGITPMMSITRYLTDTSWPGTIYLILGFQKPSDFIFEREIESLKARNPMLRVAVTMSEPQNSAWQGDVGYINEKMIKANVPDIPLHRIHVCGPPTNDEGLEADPDWP